MGLYLKPVQRRNFARQHASRFVLSAATVFTCATVQAQSTPWPEARAADASCRKSNGTTDAECIAARKRKQEEERANRTPELGSPQAVGDAPLPPQGEPAEPPVITRGPLGVRRSELSVGVDHALSPAWVVGGQLGVSRTRLHRSQSEMPAHPGPSSIPQVSDTTVRANGSTAALAFTHFPKGDLFIDTTLAFQRTSLRNDRVVNDLVLFSGDTRSRAVSLSLAVGEVWRYRQGIAVAPQAGLDYSDARVSPLRTRFIYLELPSEPPHKGFEVSAQHQKQLSATVGAQLQWVRSTSFGTLTPYLRTMLRQRLWLRGNDVVATANGADPVVTDPQLLSSKRSATLAAGVLAQFMEGVSLFADFGATRGQGQLHEVRLAVGIKFER